MLNAQRIARAQERMREKGVDAYLVLTHDDYVWFFGEDRYQPRAIIPKMGPPIIVAFRGEESEIRESLGASEVRVFATVGQQIKDVVDVMHGIIGGHVSVTVGVQMGFGTPAFLLNLFQKANPKVKVVDIAPVMDELRAIKEASDVALVRRAGEIAAVGMAAAARALRPGVVENDVAAEAEYAMRKAGGHGTATPVFVNSGSRSCWLHGTATDKRIDAGDFVVIDLVPRHLGYCANLCRTFVAGEPTSSQRELQDVYRRAQAAAIEAMRPGARVRDVDAAAKAVFDGAGHGDRFVAGISHGIGLAFEEMPAPTIHPLDSGVEIREGMTMTAGHSVLAVPGFGGVRIEDTFHVTASKIVPLTNFPITLETASWQA
ncbi:MAG: aminopeptidase P family protein [Planctomycetes bacterium]|nr:aminopeptidase P family protein [Planctomycetota bacterium]